MINISIIVPFYNTGKYIKDCAESLLSQRYPASDYEIIFVDNNSTDESLDILKRYPELKIISESKYGPYAARNKGIKESTGRIIAFTDSDCVAYPEWLAEIEKAMSDPLVSLVLGQQLLTVDSLALSMLQDYENEKNTYVFGSNDVSIYFGNANNLAVRRELLNEVGLFIERRRGADTIFVNNVATKYSTQAVKYSEQMKVRHIEIEKPLEYYKKLFIYGRSRKSYKPIANVLPISYSQRLSIYKKVIKKGNYSYPKSIMLFFLLLTGMVFWQAGTLSASIHKM